MDVRVGFSSSPARSSRTDRGGGNAPYPFRPKPSFDSVRFGGNTVYPLHDRLRRERSPNTHWWDFLNSDTWFKNYRPDVKTLERILDQGKIDINLQDERKKTLLHVLMERRDASLDEIRLLLSRGANVNLQDEHGKSTLHILTEREDANPQQIRLLLANGANVHLKNNAGQTPIFALLDQEKPNLDTIKALVEAGARLDEKSSISHPPILGFLTRHANPDPKVLKYLLDHGVKLNERYGWHRRTPLHWAVEHQQPSVEAVKLLLEYGANPHIKDAPGKTPFQHYQEKFSKHNLPEALQVLQRHMEKVRQHTPTLRIEELDEATESATARLHGPQHPAAPTTASGIRNASPRPALPSAQNSGPVRTAWQKLLNGLKTFWARLLRFLGHR